MDASLQPRPRDDSRGHRVRAGSTATDRRAVTRKAHGARVLTRQSISRALLAVLLAIFLAVTIGCGGGDEESELPDYPEPTIITDAPDGSDQQAVDEIIEISRRQAEALADGDWQALYNTFSPEQRIACPFSEFIAGLERSAQRADEFDVSRFSFDHIAIDVEGDRAELRYGMVYDGRLVRVAAADNPDVFVEIDGAWYDEVDQHAPFGC